MAALEFRIKFVSDRHEPDFIAHVQDGDTMEAVVQQVCKAKHIPQTKRLRILCAGRELYADDLASKAPGRVLHCIVTDTEPQQPEPAPQRKAVQPPPPVVEQQPPVDWLDVVDPETVLMWIFGSILALLWLLFMFYANMFDKTSIVMLVMMTLYLRWQFGSGIHTTEKSRPDRQRVFDQAADHT
ncbi:hypothetical protein VOLCADRAFT_120535 [Volvox carteri f. nagariensis]|uniref:Ubiquitin-like domain-containing protein n=1 Tax=Volvox carteri f. nagariensis TaxID=3068 RepID=D8TNR0_VOLCA|nr:uncharacterized protein VOLCADRAFT_120535 [Volvox carteri f. nagariensis]EFJ50883.1 hypothetical protein VOLCADRAFT_120535 [Volvox carteri f. nagariensis]|eukprot:XP_002947895.1 hypothetical protein VOLCADRAFT_120535 [Volvox carteri f. nagariensis]